MILNSIVLLLIILITLYLSTQGMLSSLLALATSIFSSILAMALMEPLQGIIAGWRIDYARGITFLSLYLVFFAITRFAADFAVPGNIKLSRWINRLVGGFVGFFTALVVMGTVVIGIEMLPLPRVLLDFNRFPSDAAMRGEVPGEAGGPRNGIWFAADRFVMNIWNGASGRSLGGAKAWASVHPDISVESYGYRNNVSRASQRSLPADLFEVKTAWVVADPKEYQSLGIPFEADKPIKHVAMVRTKVLRGDKEPHVSADPGSEPFFRISASQVRMVTDKRRQYYPVGYLDAGKKFMALPLDSGHLVDDYVNSEVIEDWVFQFPEDENPTLIEVKQFGRKELTGILGAKIAPPEAARVYPQRPYLKELASLSVTIDTRGKPLVAAHVYLLKQATKYHDVASLARTAYDNGLKIQGASWLNPHKAGVPTKNDINYGMNGATNTLATDPKESISYTTVLPLLMAGQAVSTPEENLRAYPDFFESTLVPMWTKAVEGSAILDSATITEGSNLDLSRIVATGRSIVITVQTKTGFYVWWMDHVFKAQENMTFSAVADMTPGSQKPADFKIDLDEKVPAP